MSQGKGPGTRDRTKPRTKAAARKAVKKAPLRQGFGPGSRLASFTADEDHRGERIDRYLAGEIPDYSRSQIQRLIESGQVGHSRYPAAKSNSDIRQGDVITVALPEPIASAAQAA